MNRLLISAFGLALMLALSACSGNTLRGGVLEPPREAMPIDLTDYTGKPFRLTEHQGKVVLMFFGYTQCPDVCPTTLADMARVKRMMRPDEWEKVRVAFITVDLARDTPEKLAKYIPLFDKGFYGLTGTPVQMRQVMSAYQVKAVRRDSTNAGRYSIDHSAFTYVVDKQGRLRELINFGAPVEDLVHDLRILVAE